MRVFLPFLPGNLNISAGWITTTTQSTQFNGRSNAFAGAFTVQAAYTLDYLAAVRILTLVMATLIMLITLSTGGAFSSSFRD